MATLRSTGKGINDALSTTVATDTTVSVVAGDLIVVSLKSEGSPVGMSVSDSAGNSYSAATTQLSHTGNNDLIGQKFYAIAGSTASVTITGTLASAHAFKAIKAHVFAPGAGSSWTLGPTSSSSPTNSTGVAWSAGSVTAPVGVAVASFYLYGTRTMTAGSGWTIDNFLTNAGTVMSEYRIVASSLSITGDASTSAGSDVDWIGQLATFTEAAAGGGATLAGNAAASGVATGALARVALAAGAAAASGVASGALTRGAQVAAAATGSGVATGALARGARLAGAAAGSGVASGTLAGGGTQTLAGAAASSGTAAGALLRGVRLASAAAASGTGTAVLQVVSWPFYVTIGTPNTTAANRLTAAGDLATGDVVGYELVTVFEDGTFIADPEIRSFRFQVLSGGVWGAEATQTVTAVIEMAGAAVAASTAQAALQRGARLAGAAAASAVAGGELAGGLGGVTLAGNAVAAGTATGALLRGARLAAAAQGNGVAAAALLRALVLAGNASAAGTASATLGTVGGSLAGAVVAALSASGTLAHGVPLAGGAIGVATCGATFAREVVLGQRRRRAANEIQRIEPRQARRG